MAVNDAPEITTAAITTATEDQLYTYDVSATDADPGDTLTYSLETAPMGIDIDPVTGMITGTPGDEAVVSSNPITVVVTDSQGATDSQSFNVTVTNVNDAPVIYSIAPDVAFTDTEYDYPLQASDPDPAETFTFSIATGPAGMTIDSATGALTWTPTAAQIGTHTVTALVTDAGGLMGSQTFTVEVAPDARMPIVTLTAIPEAVAPGDDSTITVIATDDTGIDTLVVTVDGVLIALDANHQALFNSTTPGTHEVQATVTDHAGNVTVARANIGVFGGADDGPPVVEITSPQDDDELTYLHDVVGTVTDNNLLHWTLVARRTDRQTGTELARGYDNITAGTLATIDTTLLQNGYQLLSLRATDTNGNTTETDLRIRVGGGAKVGVVQMGFVDVGLETLGIPLTVVRRYDSRDKVSGDFGHGWTLDVKAGSVRNSRVIGDGYAIYTSSRPFSFPCQEQLEQVSHFTEVRLSDRDWYLFKPTVVNIQAATGRCTGDVIFEFVDGSAGTAQLFSLDNNTVGATPVSPTDNQAAVPPSFLYDVFSGEIYDPQRFQMQTADGRIFNLSVQNGIEQIEDANGNAVAFQDSALIHSGGNGVQLVRDAYGRIERVIDPLGAEVNYTYDAQGDLVAVTDQVGGTTEFLYESHVPHHLTGIIDRQGNRVAAMEYTEDGRLKQLCDADGGCARNDYDLGARTWNLIDATQRPILRTYDERGNVTKETNGLGHETKYRYDSKDRLIELEDATGAKTVFGYDLSGNLTSRVEPVTPGRPVSEFKTTWTFDSGDRRTNETLPSGGSYGWAYDTNGNELTVSDGDSNVLRTRTYGTRGEVLTESDRFGTVTFTYGAASQQPATMIGADGVTTTFAYDNAERMISRTRAGVTQIMNYDGAGRPTSTDYGNGVSVGYEYGTDNTWKAIEGPTFGRVERRFSAMGRLLGWTLPNGDTFGRQYDGNGRVRVESDELGNQTLYDYDDAGQLETVEDVAAGALTTFVRDSVGRATKIVDGLSNEREVAYRPDGRIDTVTDERDFDTSFSYTPTSTSVTDPLLRVTTLSQNAYGLPTGTSFPGGTSTSSTFNGQTVRDEAQFHPSTRLDELTRSRTFGYDTRSGLNAASDLAGQSWQYAYETAQGGEVTFDVFGGDVSLRQRSGRQSAHAYRSGGDEQHAWSDHENGTTTDQLSSVTSPEGDVTTWAYNATGQVQSVTFPWSLSETRTYDAAAWLDVVTKADGVALDYDHDVSGREISMAASDGTARAYTYGAGDRVATMTDGSGAGTTAFSYDAAGRFAGSGNDFGSIGYSRDVLGRVEQMDATAPGLTAAYETAYGYDAAGNIIGVTDRRGASASMVYDSVGRLESVTYPGGSSTEYGYDDRDRILSVVHRDPGNAVILSRTYMRNDAGEPTKITNEDGSFVDVGYDTAGRVQSESYRDTGGVLSEEIAYGYDLDGNRTSRSSNAGAETYEYVAGARLARVLLDGVETQRFAYDDSGRVTEIERDGVTQSLTWDALDRLVRIDTSDSGLPFAEYAYDGNGKRVRVSRPQAGVAHRYVSGATGNQGLESALLVTDDVGGVTGDYVFAGEHALWRHGGGTGLGTNIYLRDAMGSVIGTVDEAGSVIDSFEYDAFGVPRGSGGSALPAGSHGGDSRFQGMFLDAGSGLYFVRARYYDARTGRFLSRDPAEGSLETPESFFAYVFANGNPHVFRDPTGLTILEFLTAVLIRTQLALASIGSAGIAAASKFGEVARAVAKSGRTISSSFKFASKQGASALQKASDAAFKAADNINSFKLTGKHLPQAGGNYAKFADGVKYNDVIRDALRSPSSLFIPDKISGRFQIFFDAGRAIGTKGQRFVKVVVDETGKIITSFPVNR